MNINAINTTMGSDATQGSFFSNSASSPFRMRHDSSRQEMMNPLNAMGSLHVTGSMEYVASGDTVNTSTLNVLSDTEAASTLERVMSSIGANRADALSVHSGLDYGRAMGLLEGLF